MDKKNSDSLTPLGNNRTKVKGNELNRNINGTLHIFLLPF